MRKILGLAFCFAALAWCGYCHGSGFGSGGGGGGGISGDGNATHFPDGSGTWRGIQTTDVANIMSWLNTQLSGGTLTTGTFSGAVTASQFDVTRTTDPQQVQLYEGTGDGNESVTITTAAMSGNATITFTQSLAFTGTMTDGKLCQYASSGNVISCTADTNGTGDFLKDGSVPMEGALVPNAANTLALGSATAEWADLFLGDGSVINLGNDQDVKLTHQADVGVSLDSVNPTLLLRDTQDAAGTAAIHANSSGGTNDMILSFGVEDSTGESTVYAEIDGVTETVDLIKPVVTSSTVTIGTGAVLTGSNGALTIKGVGDGYDEDIKIDLNTTENVIEITSPASSATTVDFNALNLVTTGKINGALDVVGDSGNHTLTATELYGGFVEMTGAGTVIINDNATTGMSFCVFSTGANAVLVRSYKPSDSIILKAGTDLGSGVAAKVTTAGQVGCFIASSVADKWRQVSGDTWATE